MCCGEEEGKRGKTGDQIQSATFKGKLLTFQTEEEASQDIKEKMSTNGPPTHGQDVHVTRDVVTESLRQTILDLCGEWGEVGGHTATGLRQVGRTCPGGAPSWPGGPCSQYSCRPYLDFVGQAPSLKV